MNIHTGYWDHGIDEVPRMTGVPGNVDDPADLRGVCIELGIALPLPSVLDVGCGTGRLSVIAERYLGADIAPSAVAFCHRRGVAAITIDGPLSLRELGADSFEWVFACSMFTHIDRDEQRGYLAEFFRIAPCLLVDILPGDEGRSCMRWGTDETGFRDDLAAAGYVIDAGTTDRIDTRSAGECRHRYFVGRRA